MKRGKVSGKQSVSDLTKRKVTEHDVQNVRGGNAPPDPDRGMAQPPDPIRAGTGAGQIVTPIAPVVRKLGG